MGIPDKHILVSIELTKRLQKFKKTLIKEPLILDRKPCPFTKMRISTYQPKYQTAIINLILPIQREEFGSAITLNDQQDLLNIPTVYQQGHGNFWIALDADQVIGTIAAIDIGHQQLVLRKMFVTA
jgi:hypothetical protein